MSQKANPTLIGVFIAAAVLLGIGGILVFSSSRFFTRTSEYIVYFDASLAGLDAGAPVRFRGVMVGAVKEVLIHHNQQPNDSALPVIIEINEDLLNEKTDLANAPAQLKTYIERGLRARLETQSLLTGLLYINLEFLPGTPIKYHQVRKEREEIPTAPNQIQVFIEDFAQIIQKMNLVLGKLDTSLDDLQTKELNRGLTNLLASLTALTASPDLTNSLASAHRTLDELGRLIKDFRPELAKLVASTDQTLAVSRDTLGEVKNGVQDLRDVIAPRGVLRNELSTALEELAQAGRSVAALADFLNQHPNAVLSGRRGAETKP